MICYYYFAIIFKTRYGISFLALNYVPVILCDWVGCVARGVGKCEHTYFVFQILKYFVRHTRLLASLSTSLDIGHH